MDHYGVESKEHIQSTNHVGSSLPPWETLHRTSPSYLQSSKTRVQRLRRISECQKGKTGYLENYLLTKTKNKKTKNNNNNNKAQNETKANNKTPLTKMFYNTKCLLISLHSSSLKYCRDGTNMFYLFNIYSYFAHAPNVTYARVYVVEVGGVPVCVVCLGGGGGGGEGEGEGGGEGLECRQYISLMTKYERCLPL